MGSSRFSFLRRSVVACAAALGVAAAGLGWPACAEAADFPTKPITLIVPVPPGGSMDATARMIAEHLQKTWGQPVIVDSKPGAATMIATQYVAKAAPDGYTLLYTLTNFLANPLVNPRANYDPVNGFAPVTQAVNIGAVMAVRSGLGTNTMAEFIKHAQANPGKVSMGTTGIGSVAHIYLEMVNEGAKIDLLHVPYKGGAPANNDLLGGQLDVNIVDPGTYRSFKGTGKVKALAINGTERMPLIPEVPTFAELGIPGLESQGWFGLFAPAGTPPDITAKLSREIGRFLQQPDVRDKILNAYGATTVGSTPEQFKQKLQKDYDRWAVVIKTHKIQATE